MNDPKVFRLGVVNEWDILQCYKWHGFWLKGQGHG